MHYEDVYHVTTFVPPDALKGLVEAIARTVPLRYGRYEQVAWWSATGTEQFKPLPGSNPSLGAAGEVKQAPSVRLEFVIPRDVAILDRVMTLGISPRANHPWEEPAVLVEESRIVVRNPASPPRYKVRNRMTSHQAQNSRTLDPSTTGALDHDQRAGVASIFAAEQRLAGSSGCFVYSRYWHPTVAVTEELLAGLEYENAWAALTSSGMAAIDCALSILQKSGSPTNGVWMYTSELYGGTLKYFDEVLKYRRGLNVYPSPLPLLPYEGVTDDFVKDIKSKRPEVVFFEPITNPSLCVLDMDEVISAAHGVGAKVIVDNTFATPLLCSPLEYGADLVVHSVTKSLSGHGNITAGIVCGRNDGGEGAPRMRDGGTEQSTYRAAVLDHRKTIGNVLSPRDAFELAQQADTFLVRASAANANALRLAEFLHGKMNRVIYPGLVCHANHKTALKQFKRNERCFGSMIAIELAESQDLDRFMDALAEGGFECRITLGDLSTTFIPAGRVFDRFAQYDRMLRISVGIEPFGELQDVFEHALTESARR
ncbi:MAG TPA: PLP-dependent transferase [Thermoanaerobaculia bacterium]|nr:PLP-dependent transferase [Thermoanaerobaculia bacterium]